MVETRQDQLGTQTPYTAPAPSAQPLVVQATRLEQTIERWSSRRFWSMMLWQGINTVLVVRDHIPSDAYVSVTWLLLGGYFLANTSQHVVDRLAEKKP